MVMMNPNKKKIDELTAFQNHMEESAHELMDVMEEGNYHEKFNIHIIHNGKIVTIEMDADAHDEMMTYLEMRKQGLEE
jgi:hypothetical protein